MPMTLTFIDANILFRMFAVSPLRLERYRSERTSGSKTVDYAIRLLLELENGDYSTSELALLEACGVAAREAGQEKAISLLKSVLEQEGLSILGIKALTYPLALSFVLEHGLQARDALHLGVAVIAHATKISTSDADFADRIEQLGRDAQSIGIRMPRLVEEMYGMTDQEARMLEQRATLTLSNLGVERAPA